MIRAESLFDTRESNILIYRPNFHRLRPATEMEVLVLARKSRKTKKNPKKSYPWLRIEAVLPFEKLMRRRGVSQVARSPRGFLTAYKKAGGQRSRLGTDSYSGQDWKSRRNNFVARHWAQIKKRNEPLWEGNEPSRRHLALIAWAFTPDPEGVRAWLKENA